MTNSSCVDLQNYTMKDWNKYKNQFIFIEYYSSLEQVKNFQRQRLSIFYTLADTFIFFSSKMT